MLRLTHKVTSDALDPNTSPAATLTLPLEQRVRSRLRVTLDDGTEAGLFLERGMTLRDGDLLTGDDGLLVRVKAAPETCSCVVCDDPLLLACAAYHLGNRHVPLQIKAGQLCYQHDHVLDDMVRGLGLVVRVEQVPFEPESGAYGGHAGGHGDGHRHHHAHGHHEH